MEELEDEIKDLKNFIETLEIYSSEKDDKIYELENELKTLDKEFEKSKELLEEQEENFKKEINYLTDIITELKIDFDKIKLKNKELEFKNFFLNNRK